MDPSLVFVIAVGTVSAGWLVVRSRRRRLLARSRQADPFAKVVFLDFDGVLHPGFSETFALLSAFELFLRSMPDTSVVISSDWRLGGRTIDQLRGIFSDAVRPQIIGTTPHLPNQNRQAEIEAYCRTHQVGRYAILDDSEDLFATGCPSLFLVNRQTGVTAEDLETVRRWLNRKRMGG